MMLKRRREGGRKEQRTKGGQMGFKCVSNPLVTPGLFKSYVFNINFKSYVFNINYVRVLRVLRDFTLEQVTSFSHDTILLIH